MFCNVIVDIASEHVAHTFVYSVPDGMRVAAGDRVKVPFGARTLEGIVLSLCDSADYEPDKIKQIISVEDEEPAVLPHMLELAESMAEETHCPLAETLRLMIPAQMRGGRVKKRLVRTVSLAPETEDTADKRSAVMRGRPGKAQKILSLLADGQAHPVQELTRQVPSPYDALKRLSEAGLIIYGEREERRRPRGSYRTDKPAPEKLTPAQQEALDEILPCLTGRPGRFLLHGVTGSGKTEVFMAAVSKVLEAGKTAIILVPEIALTPQMVAWFTDRFGDTAAVLHSGLTPGERYDEWRRIRRGEARVVIGARSAVFAPVGDLGLIVVDEEHEGSYLSDRHPRYDAREIALQRCEREHATLILASATPSILSFARARRGDYMLLEMTERVLNRPLPKVTVIDMREELENGNRSVLSITLQQELRMCVGRGEQAMLLINRRGYRSFVSCRSCGHAVKCPHCDIAMTCHMGTRDRTLKCHYCGYTRPIPTECPACGSRYIKYFGAGTQKVEEEVRTLLPGTAVIRMDLDTTSGRDGHGRVLEEFRSGRARVMIGTQMIAKGLDFPDVTLVGVVAADMTLNLPDYRSRERTFQLLTQVAGRAGRGGLPGRVVIQTYKPDDEVIRFAAAQDFRAFFENEFLRRRRCCYPPFSVMARLLIESPREAAAEAVSEALERRVRKLLDAHPDWRKKALLVKRDVPPAAMLRGKVRRHVLMKLLVSPETRDFCAALTDMAAEDIPDADVWFEYNPATMM